MIGYDYNPNDVETYERSFYAPTKPYTCPCGQPPAPGYDYCASCALVDLLEELVKQPEDKDLIQAAEELNAVVERDFPNRIVKVGERVG